MLVSKNWDERERQIEQKQLGHQTPERDQDDMHDRIEYRNLRDAKYTFGHFSVLLKQRDYKPIMPLIEKMLEQEQMIIELQEEISELQEGYRRMQLDDMHEQNNAGREDLEYIFGAELGDGDTDSIDGMLKDYVDPKQNSQELVRSVRDA